MTLRKLFFALVLAFFSLPALAQIVVVEGNRINADSTGWQGVLRYSLFHAKNVDRIFTISMGAHLQYKRGRHTFLSLGDARFVFNIDEDGKSDVNEGYQHFRYNFMLDSTFTWEAFTQLQFNQVLRIGHRWLIGTGPRVTVFKKKSSYLHIGTIYMYEYEQEIGTGIFHRDHRLSNYVSWHQNLSESIEGALISYYQPRLDEFTDYRLSGGLTFNFKIGSHFAIGFAGNLVYDSKPVQVENINNLTYDITNNLSYKF